MDLLYHQSVVVYSSGDRQKIPSIENNGFSMEGILYPMLLIPPPPVPLLFQDGILHRIFIPGCAVWIVYKGDEFQEHALPAHAQLFAQVLTGKVIVLGIGVDAPCALLGKEIGKEGLGRLEGVPLALVGLVQHPAGAEGVPWGVLACMGLARLRVGVDLPNDLAAFLQGDGEVVLRLAEPLFHFCLRLIQRV